MSPLAFLALEQPGPTMMKVPRKHLGMAVGSTNSEPHTSSLAVAAYRSQAQAALSAHCPGGDASWSTERVDVRASSSTMDRRSSGMMEIFGCGATILRRSTQRFSTNSV